MLFRQLKAYVRHDESKIWYLCRSYNEDIKARWSRYHNAYECDVSETTYNNQWEETGYSVTSALLTDADLGNAEIISEG